MKFKLSMPTTKSSSCNAAKHTQSNTSIEVDVREEYANAFRTQSYIDFWTRVLDHTINGGSTIHKTVSSINAAARLPSYRLFAEHLLDPDQPTVAGILTVTKHHAQTHSILTDYFAETANASIVCGSLLEHINRLRSNYQTLKTALKSTKPTKVSTQLADFSNSLNPFSTPTIQSVQVSCFNLLKRLESSRDKAQTKLKQINMIKHGSAVTFVVLTVSLTVIIVTHALAILMAAPGILVATMELASSGKLVKISAQLDVAAKGTYILNRDLDTISRLVARLSDELEDMKAKTRFWVKKGCDRIQGVDEFVRQLKKNDLSFREQLDELEEHLYLCFMTINRARNLVVKEIVGTGLVS